MDYHTTTNPKSTLNVVARAKRAATAAAKKIATEYGTLPRANGKIIDIKDVAKISRREGGIYVALIGVGDEFYAFDAVYAAQEAFGAGAKTVYDNASDRFFVCGKKNF